MGVRSCLIRSVTPLWGSSGNKIYERRATAKLPRAILFIPPLALASNGSNSSSLILTGAHLYPCPVPLQLGDLLTYVQNGGQRPA